MLNETAINNEIKTYLKELGCPIVREDVIWRKNNVRTSDLVGYLINEKGEASPQVVVEIKLNQATSSIPGIQQRLHAAAESLNCPYALLVINEKKYWFDGKTLLPIDEPKLESSKMYLENVEEIEKIFTNFLSDIRRVESQFENTPDTLESLCILGSGLLVRAHLSIKNQMDDWNVTNFIEKVEEARSFFNVNQESNISNDLILTGYHKLIEHLEGLPPIDPVMGKAFLQVIQSMFSKDGRLGESGTTSHIQKIFKLIISKLDIHGKKAIDLAVGFGSVAFNVVNEIDVESFQGLEKNPRVFEIAKTISIISGLNKIKIFYNDTLLFREDAPENRNSYALVTVDPPLASVPNYTAEYVRFSVAQSRRANVSDFMIEQSLQLAQPGGYIVALVPESTLFSSGSARIVRDLIKQEAIIEGIISLPPHTLKPYTNAKVNIMILRKKSNRNEKAKELFLGRPESVNDIEGVINEFNTWRMGGSQ
ncbi:N-6 DNA methylase [Virgibacillus halodenitrificans]|uniref:N-6 DNA methylase n=1 Tax=Virgibacillus halodenitrificans TaxID=1482 RepID=UPI002DBCDE18|nr:N-6 DNA methylase [Virgibacillus halodenitrificans]MEC2158010.1 N-6 DNA methylase [Virgibacillus halodenitrificans]